MTDEQQIGEAWRPVTDDALIQEAAEWIAHDVSMHGGSLGEWFDSPVVDPMEKALQVLADRDGFLASGNDLDGWTFDVEAFKQLCAQPGTWPPAVNRLDSDIDLEELLEDDSE